MPLPSKRKGLGTDSEALPEAIHRQEDHPLATVLEPVDTLDQIAHHVDGAFCLAVETKAGKYRRRVFLTAASAERAAGRAAERGENSVVYLCELKPLWRVVGGESQ